MARYSKVVKSKKKKENRFLPETAHVFMARRFIDATGIAFFLVGAAILLSIASYHHTDPSWNTASAAGDDGIGNWLGISGSYISDFLLQTIGLGGLVFGLVFVVWGFRIFKRQSLSPLWLRVLTLIISAFTASIMAARLSSGGWLLAPYMGGSIGIMSLQALVPVAAFDANPFSPYTAIATLAGLISAATLFFAIAVRREEYAAIFRLS